jgi:hypothetical protein
LEPPVEQQSEKKGPTFSYSVENSISDRQVSHKVIDH